ncbi:MAG TPA: cysteine rich repeat-containing protein [Pseudolabrys sp.]|nr:cysteine rich repeat-containing protein [Pseudolabrys sp.]
MLRSICAIGTIVLLSTTYTVAQQQIARECAADIRAACGDVPAGGGAIRSCLNSHLADLTQPCRTFLIGAAAVAGECRGDVQAMCGNVQPGGGRIEACLQSHLTELSAPCMDVMARTVGSGVAR